MIAYDSLDGVQQGMMPDFCVRHSPIYNSVMVS